MTARYTGGLGGLPREIQSQVATHVRGLHFGTNDFSKKDLASLRLCNKRFAEIGEPLLHEYHLGEPLWCDEDSLFGQKLERHLRAACATASLPANALDKQVDGEGGQEASEIYLTEVDLATSSLIRRASRLSEIALVCKTRETSASGQIRILRHAFNAIISSSTLTNLRLLDIDAPSGLNLAAEAVVAATGLQIFHVRISSMQASPSIMIPAAEDFEATSAKFRLTRAIFAARRLRDLRLWGPCLTDVAPHSAFKSLLSALDNPSLNAGAAAAEMIRASATTLRYLELGQHATTAELLASRELAFPKLQDCHMCFVGQAEPEALAWLSELPALRKLSISAASMSARAVCNILESSPDDAFARLRELSITQHTRDEDSVRLEDLCAARGWQLKQVAFMEETNLPEAMRGLLELIADGASPQTLAEAMQQPGSELHPDLVDAFMQAAGIVTGGNFAAQD